MIGLIFFVLFSNVREEPEIILLFTLVMTLLATAITLILLRRLTWPVRTAAHQLEEYRTKGIMPSLPRSYHDEAGILMANVQRTIEENHDMGSEKLDLIYLLSHDLRNFAVNSQALAKLIIEETENPSVNEYAGLIVDSTQQQFHFLENFIRLIKDEEEISRKVPVLRMFAISEILEILNKERGNELSKKALALVVDHNVSHIQLAVEFELLMRVLVNLLDNAIKFSQRGSCIRLNFHEDKVKTLISISDEGVGFDPDKADALFRKFTPMARKGTESEPSTGIGLYLCRKIIEKYEGKLLAESKGPNKGATFRILFATPEV
ncbi:HAMP domain-containing histidine kinase [Flavobacterium sp. MAH-1]|uniref:histidine kinase n=1 Tax=Flavobacterium agri TaxID=2743471 RepID=A0A7Y8Y158_9FLAO|nr:HAMP domain-containing sensor histidine kinase [Flavobacterium agri]NUY79386.1 HAMP domain-containing histidine kinase [Flavobacterium agri]NYA69410.1 HAMP domain-containing histidine kinase [Flavobacterium agri]